MVLGKNMETGERTEYGYNALSMKVNHVQKSLRRKDFDTKETSYVPDYLSSTSNELMRYEKGFGATRSIFGRGYECLGQKVTAEPNSPSTARRTIATEVIGKAHFQPDLYESPLFITNGQGEVLRYAQRNVWGDLQFPVQGDLNISGLEEGMQFTSYSFDPVIQKYFAKERFYDSIQGRMMSPDPIKRGVNAYAYCKNDPVNYTDETGEIANVIVGGLLGGLVGGAFGFAGSAVSQLTSGQDFNLKKALGSAANGAVVGAVKGALVSSGAGLATALVADFAGGAIGSGLEQWIGDGKVNVGKSITSGLTNAVSGAIYGNTPFNSIGQAFKKGAAAGAVTAGINNLSDALTANKNRAVNGINNLAQNKRDPRTSCASSNPFASSVGYSNALGYQYGSGQSTGTSGFSLGNFVKDVAIGAVTGGIASATFYGAGKAVDALKNGIKNLKGTQTREQILKNDLQRFGG